MSAETTVQALPDDGDLVYVPAHPATREGRKDIVFELRDTESGGRAALAFTDRARLVEALGPTQPWIAVSLGWLRQLLGATTPGTLVAVDPVLADDAWRWSADDLRDLQTGDEA
jgi:hypothetical protein